MEFKFKRKYTFFFFLALLLHSGLLALWLFAPERLFSTLPEKKTVFFLILINIELILIFYLGLFRKKYYAYYDKILIKRSFFSSIVISYKDINRIKERPNDSVFLFFGKQPSFTIYYKRKKYTIRSDNSELLLKTIKNEMAIAKINK